MSKELKVFELQTQGEKFWIAAYGIVGAIKRFLSDSDMHIEELDDRDPVRELTEEETKHVFVLGDYIAPGERAKTPIFDYMKGVTKPQIITSPSYP